MRELANPKRKRTFMQRLCILEDNTTTVVPLVIQRRQRANNMLEAFLRQLAHLQYQQQQPTSDAALPVAEDPNIIDAEIVEEGEAA